MPSRFGGIELDIEPLDTLDTPIDTPTKKSKFGGVPLNIEPIESSGIERGFVGDIASSIARGVPALGRLTGQALKTIDPEGGIEIVEKLGQKVIDVSKKLETLPIMQPDISEVAGEGFIKRGVKGGIESAVPSLAPAFAGGVPGAKAGAVIGTAFFPGPGTAVGATIGGLLGGTLATLAVHGLGTYGQRKEEYLNRGIDEKIAHKAATQQALVEGGIESVSNIAGMMTFGFGKIATQPLKRTAKELLKTPIKTFAKNLTKNAALNEVPTEVLQGALGAKIDERIGVLPEGQWQTAAVESIIPALTMSVLFGVGAQTITSVQRNNIKNKLNSENQAERIQAAQFISSNIKDKELKKAWADMTGSLIESGSPIDINVDFTKLGEAPTAQPLSEQDTAILDSINTELNEKITTPEEALSLKTDESFSHLSEEIDKMVTDFQSKQTPSDLSDSHREIAKEAITEKIEQLGIESEQFGEFLAEQEIEPVAEEIPITEPEVVAEPEIEPEPIETPKQPVKEPITEKPTPTIPEGKKITHEMPDGTIMDGPEHEGAVPGSEKVVDDLKAQKKIAQAQIKKGEFVPAEELRKFPELVPEKEILEKKPVKKVAPKQIIAQLNKDFPGQDIRFDGSQGLPTGKTIYSFTPQSGPLKGRTFSTFSLDPKEIKESFNKLEPSIETKKAPKEAKPEDAIAKAKEEISIIKRYPSLSDDPKQEIAEFQKIIDENQALLDKKAKGKTSDLHKTKKRDKVKSEPASVHKQRLAGILEKIGDTKTIKIINPKTREQKTFAKIGGKFGLNVVLFRSKDKNINNINGINIQGDNTIYINQSKGKTDRTISVIGHETMHQLADNHPDLYEELSRYIAPNTKEYQEYFDALVKRRKQLGTRKVTGELSKETIFEEFISDFAGDQFQDPKFWKKLNKENPGLVDKMIEIIQDIIQKMKSVTNRVEQNILDIEAAQDVLVKAMGEFAGREKAATEMGKVKLQTTQDQTKTKAFKNFFKDSKVVDDSGEPLVVFHQTDKANVDAIMEKGFDISKGSARLSDNQVPDGFFFKPTEEDIGLGTTKDEDKIQIPVYLSMQNPLFVKDREHFESYLNNFDKENDSGLGNQYWHMVYERSQNDRKFDKQFEDAWNLKEENTRRSEEKSKKLDSILKEWTKINDITDAKARNIINKILSVEQLDGVIIENDVGSFGRKTKTFITLSPTQIKSADENVGTFDPEQAGIRFQIAKKQTPAERILERAAALRNKPKTDQEVISLAESSVPISQDDYEVNRNESKSIKTTVTTNIKKVGREVQQGLDKFLGPISTRLANINPKLKSKLRKLSFDTDLKSTEDVQKVEPLLKSAKSKMSKEDFADWDYARKNSDIEKLNGLVEKYDIRKEYDAYRDALDNLRQEGLDVGLEIGYIEDYAPRVLKDSRGFLKAIGEEGDWPVISRRLNERANEMGITVAEMTTDQKADLISSMLYGGNYGLGGVPATKERKLEKIPAKLNKFYLDSDAALVAHIYSMRKSIEARKFFGKVPDKIATAKRRLNLANKRIIELKKENASPERIKFHEDNKFAFQAIINKYKNQRDYTDNINTYVIDLIQEGEVSAAQEQELIEILTARFNEKGTRGLIQAYKNLSYIDTMGSVTSALTQIGDLAWAAYEGGLPRAIRNAFKSATGKSRITKEDVGINRIAQEFQDPGTLSDAVSKVFKMVGLEKIDSIGKESLLNSAMEKFQKKAKQNPRKLKNDIKHIFEGETDSVIDDLLNDEVTDNVKLLVYNRLLDFQPVALSEMPQKYLEAGNGRIFYMLKTFTIKQFDVFRNEAYNKIKSKDPETKIEGMKNLVRLSFFFVLANAGADELKDFVLGRETDFDDRVVDNILRLFGVSKFVTWKARTEGVGSAALKQIIPPVKFIDAATKDIIKAGDGKGLETLASVPVVGKLAYWHMGRGKHKRGDLWDRRLSKRKKKLNKIKDNLEKSKDKRAFRVKHKKELFELKKLNSLQGKLNKKRKRINQIKSRKESKKNKKRIMKLEESRTELIKKHFGKN